MNNNRIGFIKVKTEDDSLKIIEKLKKYFLRGTKVDLRISKAKEIKRKDNRKDSEANRNSPRNDRRKENGKKLKVTQPMGKVEKSVEPLARMEKTSSDVDQTKCKKKDKLEMKKDMLNLKDVNDDCFSNCKIGFS
ncbi:hypothetical protein AgCh_012223 [Apium graveolens]